MSGLERMWATWRSAYIEGVGAEEGEGSGCVFCDILSGGLADADSGVVWRHPEGRVVALLNAYPYGSGHLMVMPVRHAASPEDLTAEEGGDLWSGVSQAVSVLREAYRPDGLNVGANLGRAAGAGVPGHFHMHVLPRWSGDTNFMTSVAETRVLPEPLERTYAKVRSVWDSRSA